MRLVKANVVWLVAVRVRNGSDETLRNMVRNGYILTRRGFVSGPGSMTPRLVPPDGFPFFRGDRAERVEVQRRKM